MRPDGGFLLVNGSRANVAVRRDRIYRDITALVIGAKHIAASAVGRQKGRRIRLRYRPQQRQAAGRGIDPVARDRWPRAITDVERVAVRTDCHDRWPAGRAYISPLRQPTAVPV